MATEVSHTPWPLELASWQDRWATAEFWAPMQQTLAGMSYPKVSRILTVVREMYGDAAAEALDIALAVMAITGQRPK